MKMQKKFFSIILLTFCLTLMSACSDSNNTELTSSKKSSMTRSPQTIAAVEVDMKFDEFKVLQQEFRKLAVENDFYYSVQGEKNTAPIPMEKFISVWLGDQKQRADFDHAIYMFYTDEYQYCRITFTKEGFVDQDIAETFAKEVINRFFLDKGYEVRDVLSKYIIE